MKRVKLLLGAVPAVLIGSLLAAAPSPAVTGDGGSFVPITPARIGDTSNGVGFSSAGAFGAGTTRTLQVTGRSGVPSSNVGAVVIDVAGTSTADSRLYVHPSNENRNLASLSLEGGAGWDSTTVVVAPGSDGKIDLHNSSGSTHLNVDIQGYFTKTATAGSAGGFVPMTPARVINTSTGVGISDNLNGGTSYSFQVAGEHDVPVDAIGVYAGVRAFNASGEGGLRIVPSNVTPSTSTPSILNYDSGQPYDTGAALKLGPDGKVKLWASSGTSAVDVALDIQGYFTAGPNGGSFHPISNERLWDSSYSAGGELAPGESRTIDVTSSSALPSDTPIGTVAMAVTVKDWSGNGSVSVVNADLPDNNGTANVTFSGSDGSVARQATSFVEPNGEGQVTIRNHSTVSSVSVLLNAQGWFDPDEESPLVDESTSQVLPCSVSCEPVIAYGTADGTVEDVTLVATPASVESPDAPVHQQFSYLTLADAAVIKTGNTYTVRLAPESVPAAYVNQAGLVEIEVIVTTNKGTNYVPMSVRASAVEPTGSFAWTAPDRAQVEGTATTASRVTARSAAVPTTVMEDPDSTRPPATEGVAADSGTPDFPRVVAAGGHPGGVHCDGMWLDYYKYPQVVVGQLFPAGGATGTMKVSASTGINTGSAISSDAAGPWSASGMTHLDESWSKTWPASKKNATYRMKAEYRKRKTWCSGG